MSSCNLDKKEIEDRRVVPPRDDSYLMAQGRSESCQPKNRYLCEPLAAGSQYTKETLAGHCEGA